MANYLRPDVYVEEVSSGEKPIQSVSTSTGALIGITARGVDNEAVLVTSWTDFVENFAKGLSTPFLKNSDLPNAVYGFFQNGGSKCYIVRATSTTCTCAEGTLNEDAVTFQAKDKGDWANDSLVVTVESKESKFNVKVTLQGTIVEQFSGLVNTVNSSNYFVDVINESSDFIRVTEGDTLATGTVQFSGGVTGTVLDSDYKKALELLDLAPSVNLLAVPGASETVAQSVVSYADANGLFAIVDVPKGKTPTQAIEFRKSLSGTNASVYYPNICITDPLGRKSTSLKVCSPSGHIMGVVARIDTNRGVHKAPAGEECIVRGAVSLETPIALAHVDLMNPEGVNSILAKNNVGIIVWGARTISSDSAKRYVSDVRYDLMLNKALKEGTSWAVFEPNDENLWERVDSSIRAFLDTEWKNGALRGATSDVAYYVKCDSELNTSNSIANGQLVIEVGYAKQKPAEFVVIKLIQKSEF